jgi:hypothetical protein
MPVILVFDFWCFLPPVFCDGPVGSIKSAAIVLPPLFIATLPPFVAAIRTFFL